MWEIKVSLAMMKGMTDPVDINGSEETQLPWYKRGVASQERTKFL